MILPKMMKLAATSGVGARIVAVILDDEVCKFDVPLRGYRDLLDLKRLDASNIVTRPQPASPSENLQCPSEASGRY